MWLVALKLSMAGETEENGARDGAEETVKQCYESDEANALDFAWCRPVMFSYSQSLRIVVNRVF